MNYRRLKFRKSLNNLYLPYYDKLCELMPEQFQPYSGFRSFVEQDDLYRQGRTESGKVVTYAHGGESPHNYGCASDWCIFDDSGKPSWPEEHSTQWQLYIDTCKQVGVRLGVRFAVPDMPHNELALRVSWGSVLPVYKDKGLAGVLDYIESNLISDYH